jgi:hypothetical protein
MMGPSDGTLVRLWSCGLICAALTLATAPAAALTATSWDEALALSRQHEKPILIDFFTEW